MTRRTSRLPQIPDLFAGLVDPRLTGARCVGKAPLFDAEAFDDETDEQRSQRIAWARTQCAQCPVQSACRTAATEQNKLTGLWAGHVHGLPGRPQKGNAA
ncbi:WhiB family transcriptional regulator [Rhodococcus gordoniae]|uniref:WhiB family transcriptional regulator n=1 Tax=Rhodococcus gordoniae TaxID=223392 RepID=UPI0020CEFF70|nr:WhiB family transcriptional regulator [Rhodococcus gordoniae]UTT48847.1 WhiB family transcriptional regulator [Rhodococcus gordoniae]